MGRSSKRSAVRSPISRRATRFIALCSGLAVAFVLPASAMANVPFQTINSAGPLTELYVGNELSCQAKLGQDEVYSYFPSTRAPGDCGTFLQIGANPDVYAPDFDEHDGTAASNSDWVPWTPVSQTPVGGDGSQSNPYSVTTTVAAGATGVLVRETYSYATGSRGYDVETTVINNNATPRSVRLYHAVDCYLAGSDHGYGFVDPGTGGLQAGGVFCTETPNNNPPGRALGFTPSQPANFVEGFYDDVWAVTGGADYPNTAEPDLFQDNGLGLQFNLTVPGGARAAQTVSLRGTVDSGDNLATAITKAPKKKVKTKKKKAKATFEFSASLGGLPAPAATFTCTVDNQAPVPCTSPFTTTVKKGNHTFSVLTSLFGETAQTPSAVSWKVKRKKKKKKKK
jgi:hypothetical protein